MKKLIKKLIKKLMRKFVNEKFLNKFGYEIRKLGIEEVVEEITSEENQIIAKCLNNLKKF